MTRKFLTKKLVLISVLSIFGAGLSHAADSASDSEREAHRKMKHEQRDQRREMRRDHRAESMLFRVDANKDGQIDLDEYLAHAQERFNKLDADSNGYVSKEEAKASMEKMRKEHRERRKKMRERRTEASG